MKRNYRRANLIPAIHPGFEAVYYEMQLVLVKLFPQDLSFILRVPVNLKSSNLTCTMLPPLYQPNGHNKTVFNAAFPAFFDSGR